MDKLPHMQQSEVIDEIGIIKLTELGIIFGGLNAGCIQLKSKERARFKIDTQ